MFRTSASLLSWRPSGCRLAVLIYHRVLAEPDPLLPSEPDARVFHWQMRELAKNFRVLPLSEAIERLGEGRLPPRSACVTFDDGYADNADVALPILKLHGLVATFFITTGVLDGGRMWNDSIIEALRVADAGELDFSELGLGAYSLTDIESRRSAIDALLARVKYKTHDERTDCVTAIVDRIKAAKRGNLMLSSERVRDLARSGMEIGAHTVTHPLLVHLSDAAARDEIEGSRARLREITGSDVRLFAYPNGRPAKDYGVRDVELVRRMGFVGAVSTAWGAGWRGTDPFQVPRFTPWDRAPKRFVLRLIGNYARPPESRVPLV